MDYNNLSAINKMEDASFLIEKQNEAVKEENKNGEKEKEIIDHQKIVEDPSKTAALSKVQLTVQNDPKSPSDTNREEGLTAKDEKENKTREKEEIGPSVVSNNQAPATPSQIQVLKQNDTSNTSDVVKVPHSEVGKENKSRETGKLKMAPTDTAETAAKVDDVKVSEVNATWNRITRMTSHGEYGFNATATDLLTLHRTLPDIRPEKCHSIKYDLSRLPRTSVVIPFFNEAWSTLLRTVHSVLDATPPELLLEVILVDDNSTYDYLGAPLADYVDELEKVKLYRLEERSGLMVARQHGASRASGDVLFFLDSHSEMGTDWLQPLVARIKECRSCVVIPVMDLIKPHDFEFMRAVPDFRGTFDWDMTFRWRKIPIDVLKNREGELSPIPTPTMVGCAHGIDRKYFWELGAYDTTMEIWGAENIEHSFRIWMCGGRLETIPCSRVAHVFKHGGLTYTFKSVKTKSSAIIQKNQIKTVELWLDEHRDIFYATQWAIEPVNYTHIEQRQELRKQLGCKPFSWYVENIIPDTPVPLKSNLYFGQLIHHTKEDTCLSYDVISRDGHVVSSTPCSDQYVAEHAFHFDANGKFMFYARCFNLTENATLNLTSECNNTTNTWTFENSMLKHLGTNRCLGLDSEGQVTMTLCAESDASQKWRFTYHFNWDIGKKKPWEETLREKEE
ncbi:inactive polypeptide N-acetylgalactosaminyltransferase-like protein 5 [Lingula anatina]|uniref:Polypeptide N-acetylgalactosaminyltransferase n=1 Tax=Lingula anatina TaxID=7574 RepID=A0A1S3HFF5_LINAN|nr:inactive polypeptide N-acetylgalactosaminyltransferase-like protein 5 [Lingula anatina]|eukprot:XP_013384201.1 inactive polypeptide N-acetylgalactosaminyltransferase-like protein 5 [Lingula anatina]